jgi:hypothetical protein
MDIDEFRRRLKADDRLRANFIRDPLTILRQHKVNLPKEVEDKVAESVRTRASGRQGTEVLATVGIKF